MGIDRANIMTGRRLLTVVLLAVFSMAALPHADAQFFKRLFKGKKHHSQAASDSTASAGNDPRTASVSDSTATHKETRKERKERLKKERKEKKEKEKAEKKARKKNKKKGKKADVQAPTQKIVRQWADIEFPASQRKKHYRVDVLAPLYLDELVRNGYVVKDIPEKAVAGLNFYKGVQIAVDTLKQAGFDVDIYVHDVASLLESTDMLVSKKMLDSADLIIGAVPPRDVTTLATYARNRKVNFVSALTDADGGVKDNQFLTILQPSLKDNCAAIAGHIEGVAKAGKPVLLFRTAVTGDNNAAKFFLSPDHVSLYRPLSCNIIPHKEELAKLIDSGKDNIIVMPVADVAYADTLLHLLGRYFPSARFQVYGMPSWSTMKDIYKSAVFKNISVNIPTAFNFNMVLGSFLARSYEKTYGEQPDENAYRGYEATFWYVNMLKRHGTIFNRQYDDVDTAPFTKFEIKPEWDEQGALLYEQNTKIFLTTYDGYYHAGTHD